MHKFVYGQSYLARENAVPIDPFELKLNTGTYETNLLKGVFGSLRDASPDYWGRRVIKSTLGKRSLAKSTICCIHRTIPDASKRRGLAELGYVSAFCSQWALSKFSHWPLTKHTR